MPEPDPRFPQKPEDGSRATLIVVGVLGAVIAFFYWQELRHQNYLRRTSPEQQARDRVQMAIEDAQDPPMPRGY